ncbi:MAG TPA: PilN domain-containing protein [Steroidobacteraceae bacterium]|nr:PilN domain-containing protein [Steroidobacteraceae bacterium]
MLGDLFRWWTEQLRGLAPEPLRRLVATGSDAVVVDFGPDFVAFSLRRRGGLEPIGRFARDAQGLKPMRQALARLRARNLRVALRLAPGMVLRKQIALPLAARRNLPQVLAFEMGRETPFEDGEVFWDNAILQQDRATQRMEVEVAFVPRAQVAEVIDILRAAGGEVSTLEVEAPGRTYRMAMRKDAELDADARWWPATVLGAVAGMLALIAVALPFFRQQQQLAALKDALQAVETQTKAVVGMKKEIEQLSKAANFLAEERARVADPLAILAAATRAIPDDGYLIELVLRDNRLSLVGVSPSAADLIGRLAATKPFQDPVFAAPVVRRDAGKLELFTISASIGAGGSGS